MTNLNLLMENRIGSCTEKQLPEILDIFNEAILNSTALYDYKPRTMENMKTWYAAKQQGNFPIIGVFDPSEKLLGFTSFGSFRNWPAYKYSVEHSIYIRSDRRGEGLGKLLLRAIIKNAEEQDYHVLIGGIDASNTASIHLHEMEGFVLSGTIRQAGFKFGKWLDLSFYQLTLKTPENPK